MSAPCALSLKIIKMNKFVFFFCSFVAAVQDPGAFPLSSKLKHFTINLVNAHPSRADTTTKFAKKA